MLRLRSTRARPGATTHAPRCLHGRERHARSATAPRRAPRQTAPFRPCSRRPPTSPWPALRACCCICAVLAPAGRVAAVASFACCFNAHRHVAHSGLVRLQHHDRTTRPHARLQALRHTAILCTHHTQHSASTPRTGAARLLLTAAAGGLLQHLSPTGAALDACRGVWGCVRVYVCVCGEDRRGMQPPHGGRRPVRINLPALPSSSPCMRECRPWCCACLPLLEYNTREQLTQRDRRVTGCMNEGPQSFKLRWVVSCKGMSCGRLMEVVCG